MLRTTNLCCFFLYYLILLKYEEDKEYIVYSSDVFNGLCCVC